MLFGADYEVTKGHIGDYSKYIVQLVLSLHTVWRVIFGGTNFCGKSRRPSELIFVV